MAPSTREFGRVSRWKREKKNLWVGEARIEGGRAGFGRDCVWFHMNVVVALNKV